MEVQQWNAGVLSFNYPPTGLFWAFWCWFFVFFFWLLLGETDIEIWEELQRKASKVICCWTFKLRVCQNKWGQKDCRQSHQGVSQGRCKIISSLDFQPWAPGVIWPHWVSERCGSASDTGPPDVPCCSCVLWKLHRLPLFLVVICKCQEPSQSPQCPSIPALAGSHCHLHPGYSYTATWLPAWNLYVCLGGNWFWRVQN